MAGGKKSKDHRRNRVQPKRETSLSGDDLELDIDAFNRILHAKNLYVRDVSSDGNCLFRAVSDQLYGNESRHLDLRQQACRYMREHEEAFAPFIDDSCSFAEYVDNMEVENRWGGNIELQALSCSLLLDVRIHQVEAPSYDIKNDHGKRNKDKKTVHLSYHEGQHYASVRRKDEGENFEGAAHSSLSVAAVTVSSRMKDLSSNGEDSDNDGSVVVTENINSVTATAQANANDLAQPMMKLAVQEKSRKSAAPSKRSLKKKSQQARNRERKRNRLRVQEREAVGHTVQHCKEIHAESEVSI